MSEQAMERDVPALLQRREPQTMGGTSAVVARENSMAGLVQMAQTFPRDPIRARRAINNAFTDPALAAISQYQFAKGGNDIEGPSVHSARAMVQHWGRMGSGIRILGMGRGPDGIQYTECEAWAFDYESISGRSVPFVVRHWRSTKKGGYPLNDDREVGDLIANIGSRRERGCILALLPRDVVEDAMRQADVTNEQKADVSEAGIKAMTDAFAEHGVSIEMIEKRIQRPLASVSPAQMLLLRKVFTSLRDGVARVGQHFEVEDEQPQAAPSIEKVRTAAPPVKESNALPDVADVLHRIRGAQTFEELQDLDEEVGRYGEADKAVLVEALKHRDRQLDGGTAHKENE